MPKLNARQLAFVDEYIVDFNAKQAAVRAGYSERSAFNQSSRLMMNDEIQQRISQKMEERSKRCKVDADYVLNRLVAIDQMDVADIIDDGGGIRPVHDWPEVWRQTISGFDVTELHEGYGDERKIIGLLKKLKLPDKLKNLELLGKHVDVDAFGKKEDEEITVTPVKVVLQVKDASDGGSSDT